jgi:pimeloyl-ACP methyl ester carboxylesterase
MTTFHHTTIRGRKIFYREAGSKASPTIVLLHGTHASSHMFRDRRHHEGFPSNCDGSQPRHWTLHRYPIGSPLLRRRAGCTASFGVRTIPEKLLRQ